ncbi:composite domain of metallo-dependent hydrolase [Lentinus tigrinus ALCF2SS1-7]|uniref:Composite domain of metallo-dependent hydrolase n=1 Tax=Lentinus tigrinus ALCF2SS1-6 TaxID=1328759 RepID=A0A5C2RZR3_9APHY|nr:composite domain of metallo-dependent hydrolase [Lentinus tigrinus ALCF2SS1-6]RPD79611.1 composite domain of metallo-dependent hydrolase [Lentinus tigrinus ALCF2SS1-7]
MELVKVLYTETVDPPLQRLVLRSRGFRPLLSIVLLLAAFQACYVIYSYPANQGNTGIRVPLHAEDILEKCRLLEVPPGPPPEFLARQRSDRFVPGTRPTLIKNATIWTGGREGFEVVHGDILLDGGLIRKVGSLDMDLESLSATHIDAQGKWVTPGIVDLHSHLGVYSMPALDGTFDGNSWKGPILPWLRALDALNTHDDAFQLSASGGVTTALVLPGSANAIGGQGAVIKLRHTESRSPTSMLLENPYEMNKTEYDPGSYFRYRHMKHACGENPDRFYANTRMDTVWAFRQAYEKARQIRDAQDDFCSRAKRGDWAGLGEYPEDLQWEALVDVLRGRVKVHTHCYEAVDLDDLVRITNEFKFPIAAFHHAHETYLVPDTLKSAYGGPPAAALFATHARYKRESYRGSEFAPRILAESGIRVVMKSDHPVLDSRFLLYEAQQAFYYGLPPNLALASVTSTPAQVLGLDHRIGHVKEGFDADIVLWDSHPLALGATPQQVWIDGIPQLSPAHTVTKPAAYQQLPKVPNFDEEAKETLDYDGLPPLNPKSSYNGTVIFANVSSVFLRAADGAGVTELPKSQRNEPLWAVVRRGKLVCTDVLSSHCVQSALRLEDEQPRLIDLKGGSISPGLTTYGSALGLGEIMSEASTQDGIAPDLLSSGAPWLAGGSDALIHAADGLVFGTRHALLTYRSGVTSGIVAPMSGGFMRGLNVAFSTRSSHKLEDGAIIHSAGAVHVSIHPSGKPSVSTQVAALRRLLLLPTTGELGAWFDKIRKGEAPLVIDVESADIMSTLISLKSEVERTLSLTAPLRFTFTGAGEAYLVAKELGNAKIGVILTQPRPFPKAWETRRILPGPPLSEKSRIVTLLEHNVTVALGVDVPDKARNTRFDVAWAALESRSVISKVQAIALASANVENLLGVERDAAGDGELVVTREGELLGYGKIVGFISPLTGTVDIL